MADIILLKDFVVNRQHSPARISKDNFNALFAQGFNHHSGSGHRSGHRLSSSSAGRSALVPQARPFSQQKAPGGQSGAQGYRFGFPLPALAPSFYNDDEICHDFPL
jgi:hypothetical protein